MSFYRLEVEDVETGREIMRLRVEAGLAKYMEVVRVIATDSDTEMLWVVDNEGGRDLCRWCKRIGARWKTAATWGIVRLVPEVAR